MLINATAADVLRPVQKNYAAIYDTALVIGGSLIIGLLAQVSVWLPFSPIPVSGQTLAVLMMAALLGRNRAVMCVFAYLAQGAAGMPVFAAGRGGLAVLFGPTGGYLFGFIAAAYVAGSLAQIGWDRKVASTILAMILASAAMYACGLLWLGFFVGAKNALAFGLYPFVIGDLLKITIAAAVLPLGWKILRAVNPDGKN